MIVVRSLGRRDYEPLWRDMQEFTERRNDETPDELWFTEHPAVFTLGLNADRAHLLAPGDIPVVQVDRGGQVTYHGPGQLMIYPLVDLRRAGLGVRTLVCALEQAIVDLAAEFGIQATGRRDAPGVYTAAGKIASVGLRIRRGASFHGMALNVDVDLEPFSRINPCGFSDLKVTSLRQLGVADAGEDLERRVQSHVLRQLQIPEGDVVRPG